MDTVGVEALTRRVAELERVNAQLLQHNTELLLRVEKLELEAQTMHDLIWESARSSSRPPPGSSSDGNG